MNEHDGCGECFYCLTPLAPRHEHDHFPIPKRLGGTEIVPVCLGCHELVDRTPLANWPAQRTVTAFNSLMDIAPGARILFAKLIKITIDVESVAE